MTLERATTPVRACRRRLAVGEDALVVEEDGPPLRREARSPRRTRGRPSPWLFLTSAVFWSGLAAASWIVGMDLVFTIGCAAAGAAWFWASWYARRHANDPLPPGRGASSRWFGGRPDERWH